MQTKNENKENPISFISKKFSIDINQLKNILSPNNKHGVCGSVNLGNTCYMNSSIACISNCTELTTFFLTKEYKKYKNTSNKNGLNGKLADGWYLLLKDYWKGDKTYGNPKVIKKLIAKKDKKFEDDEQQDANEFIVIFLEILGEDLNTVKQKT
jgi:ubiquitin carboxyl-terminal hydrolase 4/11/15